MQLRIGYLLLTLALIVLTSVSSSQLSDQRKDFNVFKKVLLSKEGRIDLHTPESEIMAELDELENSFKSNVSLLNQFKQYSAVLSKIQCGHTQIHPTRDVLREWLAARNSLPIDIYLVGRRLVVNRLSSEDQDYLSEGKTKYQQSKTIKAGSEILSIDGETVPEMMENISPYLSSDENSIDFKYFQVANLFDFFRHLSAPFEKDSILVEYTLTGDTGSVYLYTGTAPVHSMNARLKKNEEQFKNNEIDFGSFMISQKTGYFRFHSFKVSYGKRYDAFLERCFKKMKTKKIKRLVVDLRGNTGGAMQYSIMRYFVGEGVNLGRYVVEKPKKGVENRHFKKLMPDFFKHKRASRLQRKLINRELFNEGEIKTKEIDSSLIYDGQIVVITDEGTFSSASMLACHLKTMADAKIIGRTAGGSFYAGNAGSLTLLLPKSKMKMFINPNTFYSHLKPTSDPLIIKTPDIELNPLILDKRNEDQFYFREAKNAFD